VREATFSGFVGIAFADVIIDADKGKKSLPANKFAYWKTGLINDLQ
jgi:hypothetical protein